MPVADFLTTDRRRSQRIPLSVPMMIESLEPTVLFGGRCNSVDVSLHGCQFFLSRPLKNGTQLRLVILDKPHSISLRGQVVSIRQHLFRSSPTGTELTAVWKVGVEFTRPGNFWKVESPPTDWVA